MNSGEEAGRIEETDLWNQCIDFTGPWRLCYITKAAETDDTSKQAINFLFFHFLYIHGSYYLSIR